MMRIRSMSGRSVTALGLGVLFLGPIAGVGQTSASPVVNAKPSSAWKPVSGTVGTAVNLFDPSIAKFGNSYEVIWVQATGKQPTYGIDARILNAAGKPQGPVITVLKGWVGMNTDPTIVADGSERTIAFAGTHTNGSDPYNSGAEFYDTSTDGKHWTLSTGSLSAAGADHSAGTGIAVGGNAFATGVTINNSVEYDLTESTQNPQPSFDGTTATTPFTSDAGGVVTEPGDNVWFAWVSSASSPSEAGVNVQKVAPTAGPRLHAAASHKGTSFYGVQQDLPLVAHGSSVFTAFATPDDHSVAVWRAGAAKPFATFKDSGGVVNVTMSPGPAGRLWLFWRSGSGWHATRSNEADTRFGSVLSLPYPKNISGAAITTAGIGGPLEAIAMQLNGDNRGVLEEHQFLARLSCSASPSSVKPGKEITVSVSDVGDPVKGAKVGVDGASGKTNNKGKATLKVSKKAKGNQTVVVSASNYQRCTTSVNVEK